MQAFRLISPDGDFATPLHFVDRSDAARYQKILLWPWEPLGFYQEPNGTRHQLAGLRFNVEATSLPAMLDPDLNWLVWKRDGVFGYVPLLPGRCFDPGSWRPMAESDRRDPVMAPKIAHAEREYEATLKPRHDGGSL
jgi:hypothetical protein